MRAQNQVNNLRLLQATCMMPATEKLIGGGLAGDDEMLFLTEMVAEFEQVRSHRRLHCKQYFILRSIRFPPLKQVPHVQTLATHNTSMVTTHEHRMWAENHVKERATSPRACLICYRCGSAIKTADLQSM